MKNELSWSHALSQATDLLNIAHLCKNTCTKYEEEWDQQATATLSVPVLSFSDSVIFAKSIWLAILWQRRFQWVSLGGHPSQEI